MNESFRPVFDGIDTLKDRMRNCTTYDQWQQLKNEYKTLLMVAKQVYNQYSTEDKYKAFKDRENTAISAIFQKVKKCWEPATDLADTVDNKPKEYTFYDQANYDTDFQKEVEYWQTQLFPTALKQNLQEWQVTLEYHKHLKEQYWHKLVGNPNITLANEMRVHYGIYRREHKGDNTPSDIIAN